MKRSLAVLALGLTAGCGNTYEESPVFVFKPREECVRPLAEYCGGSRCQSAFEDKVRAMEAMVKWVCGTPLGRLRIGTCGDLRYTSEGAAFGGGVQYFDAAGDLVATEWGSDVPHPDGCWTVPYGFIPRCEHKVTRDLCAP